MYGVCVLLLLALISDISTNDCQSLLGSGQTYIPLDKEIAHILPDSAEETTLCRFDLLNLNGQEALIKQLRDAGYKFCLGCGHINDQNQCHSVEICYDDSMFSNGSHVDLLAGPLNVTEPWHGCCRPLKHDGKPDKKCSTYDKEVSVHLHVAETDIKTHTIYNMKLCDGVLCNAGDELTPHVRAFRVILEDSESTSGWETWGPWSSCNCENLLETRLRTCLSTSCPDSDTEMRKCFDESPCRELSKCYSTALQEQRARVCPRANCLRLDTEARKCDCHNVSVCSVDGGWTNFSKWSSCDVSCGDGFQTRVRHCTNPSPSQGGLDCVGDGKETRQCHSQPCPVNGGWTNFTLWSSCNVTCGGGSQSRIRFCTNPSPSFNGSDCFGDGHETRRCNTQSCPVWNDWSSWNSCYENNGYCWKTRVRHCSTGNDSQCVGQSSNVTLCGQNECHNAPIDGGWSQFSNWLSCSVTCGNGTQVRVRFCNSPSPSGGGKNCTGDSVQTQTCNTATCPYWLPWGPYFRCQLANGVCVSDRFHNCSTGDPHDCGGSDNETVACLMDECVASWSDWSMISVCKPEGILCLTGFQRTCSTGNNRNCSGSSSLVHQCPQQCCNTTYNGKECGFPLFVNTTTIVWASAVGSSSTISSSPGLVMQTSAQVSLTTAASTNVISSQFSTADSTINLTTFKFPNTLSSSIRVIYTVPAASPVSSSTDQKSKLTTTSLPTKTTTPQKLETTSQIMTKVNQFTTVSTDLGTEYTSSTDAIKSTSPLPTKITSAPLTSANTMNLLMSETTTPLKHTQLVTQTKTSFPVRVTVDTKTTVQMMANATPPATNFTTVMAKSETYQSTKPSASHATEILKSPRTTPIPKSDPVTFSSTAIPSVVAQTMANTVTSARLNFTTKLPVTATQAGTAQTISNSNFTTAGANQATTKKPMATIPPKPIQCALCAGPPEACELAFYQDTCQPPTHYCINHVINKANGDKLVDRRCGNITECYHDWYLGSSDDDKCRHLSSSSVLTYNFECSFCCIKDSCNVNLHPPPDTLFTNE